jgi:Protein of unknown function (DUF3313)
VKSSRYSWKTITGWLCVMFAIAMTMGCSPAAETKPGVKKIPAGQEFSGFLKDYASLKPNPNLEGNALTFAAADAKQNLRSYFAIIVDPVEVYVATDADASKVSDESRIALTNYFQHALVAAVSDAFPVVDTPSPLTLRLRTAIVGVDVGGQVAAADVPADAKPFQNALNIGKVGVEMELVDSKTGQRIAAMVDRSNLGGDAEIGAANFSRVQKFAAAREAFDEWASRVRIFLDSEHELKGEDIQKADRSYQPYGSDVSK